MKQIKRKNARKLAAEKLRAEQHTVKAIFLAVKIMNSMGFGKVRCS